MIAKFKSLQNHQGFMKYFKNTSWLFGEKILRMVVGLFVGIWVARYLGPEQFGLFSYSQSFVGLFTAIAILGLDGIVVRELVKDESRRDELIGTAFWLKVMGAIGVLVILSIAVNFTSNDQYTNILVFIIASATIFQSFNVIDFYFQSKVLSKYVVYANIISLFISSIIKIALILNDAPLIAFAWVVLFDSFVLACGFIYFFLKTNSTFKIQHLTFSKATAVGLLRDSWPLILSGIVVSIYMKIDQVMIKEILGVEAVGYYAVAVRITEIWYVIPTLLVTSLFPSIISSKSLDESLYTKRLTKLYYILMVIAFWLSILICIFSSEIISFLYGNAFINSSTTLSILICVLTFKSFGAVKGKWAIVENQQKYTPIYQIIGMCLNIILNYILIPIYGINGAALATLAVSINNALIVPIFINKLQRGQTILFLTTLLKIITFKKEKLW